MLSGSLHLGTRMSRADASPLPAVPAHLNNRGMATACSTATHRTDCWRPSPQRSSTFLLRPSQRVCHAAVVRATLGLAEFLRGEYIVSTMFCAISTCLYVAIFKYTYICTTHACALRMHTTSAYILCLHAYRACLMCMQAYYACIICMHSDRARTRALHGYSACMHRMRTAALCMHSIHA